MIPTGSTYPLSIIDLTIRAVLEMAASFRSAAACVELFFQVQFQLPLSYNEETTKNISSFLYCDKHEHHIHYVRIIKGEGYGVGIVVQIDKL